MTKSNASIQSASTLQKIAMCQTAGALLARVGSAVSMLSCGETRLQMTAHSLSAAVAHANQQAMAVAPAAEEARVGVQNVMVAAEEFSAFIQEISCRVEQPAKINAKPAENAVARTRPCGVLTGDAQKIDEIVRLIGGFAAQRALLALDAGAEAARTGYA